MEEYPVVEHGVVTKMRRNFGFVACSHRVRDVFFHETCLEDCSVEQLSEGTAVTFVVEQGEGGKPVAKHVRLAPVGTCVQLTQLEPDILVGQVSDPARGGAKGVLRFLTPAGAPEHLFYDGAIVHLPIAFSGAQQSPAAVDPPDSLSRASGPASTLTAGTTAAATTETTIDTSAELQLPTDMPAQAALRCANLPEPHRPSPAIRNPCSGQQCGPVDQQPQDTQECHLGKGQMVFFRICTDMRAAQMAKEAAARGAVPARRMAYQWAVQLRPVGPLELAASRHLQRQAALLQLLEEAVKASKASRASEGPEAQHGRHGL